ncbi:dehydrodolichyl diphosphate synthase complex subunit nus1 [Copidosoma floridanum]|uniref:dehydrodolichyl diphosphate synthase complex subunit nus1 n=1 Tax=Copidosoma floridanum TaxID=29053 RepID=UPI0006C9B001|nr:dehydrodolichyl diphosphate synthase complex subunit nus1 [Copidosoma floridanum]
MYIIFRVILSFLHFAYSFQYFVQQQYTRFLLFIERCTRSSKVKSNYSSLKFNENLINVPKIPRHLAFLLGHEEVSVLDVVKLISWCVVAEIPFISFYDHKGNLQKNQVFIKKRISEMEPSISKNIEWPSVSGKATNGVKNVAIANKDVYTNNKNSKVGDVSEHRTKVYFLSYADCKGRIVSVTKSLAKVNNSSIFQEESITPEFLDKQLSISNDTPNPDLAIVFGKTMCTYGFLPWQTRITEFFTFPTHHDVSSDGFIKTLVKFSKCQQRYGK